jgi:hypothetical protein
MMNMQKRALAAPAFVLVLPFTTIEKPLNHGSPAFVSGKIGFCGETTTADWQLRVDNSVCWSSLVFGLCTQLARGS